VTAVIEIQEVRYGAAVRLGEQRDHSQGDRHPPTVYWCARTAKEQQYGVG
jgi:hypothetical protein